MKRQPTENCDLLSPAGVMASRLALELGGDGAKRAISKMLSQFTPLELAALALHKPFWELNRA